MSLQDLPKDVLMQIIIFSDATDIPNISRLSTVFRDIIETGWKYVVYLFTQISVEMFWKRLYEEDDPHHKFYMKELSWKENFKHTRGNNSKRKGRHSNRNSVKKSPIQSPK
jgi:hypothetical protein